MNNSIKHPFRILRILCLVKSLNKLKLTPYKPDKRDTYAPKATKIIIKLNKYIMKDGDFSGLRLKIINGVWTIPNLV